MSREQDIDQGRDWDLDDTATTVYDRAQEEEEEEEDRRKSDA